MSAKEHKKPGRPRKKTSVTTTAMLGIVREPANSENCIELIYTQPQLLKCIVSIFQLYNSHDMIIEFYPTKVVFCGRDHSRNVIINITLNAADMNQYYFSEEAVARMQCTDRAPTPIVSDEVDEAAQAAQADEPDEVDEVAQVVQADEVDEAAHAVDEVDEVDEDDEAAQADEVDEAIDDVDEVDEADEVDEDDEAAQTDEVDEDDEAAQADEVDEQECDETDETEPVFRVAVIIDTIKIVTTTIEKSHYLCTIAIREGSDRPHLFISLSCSEYSNVDCYEIATTNPIIDEAMVATSSREPNLEHFPLEFTFDSHHLRHKIDGLKKISANLQIRKYGTSDLEIIFDPTERVTYTGTYRDPTKIKLRSDVRDGQILIAILPIARIKSIMTVNMPGNVTFFVGWQDPLIIQVGLDQRTGDHYAIMVRLFISTSATI
ncbi:MAG: hypothetical protein WC919_07415 [Candidatus Paceibacterota bacterium]|jgi:hypothetical protein